MEEAEAIESINALHAKSSVGLNYSAQQTTPALSRGESAIATEFTTKGNHDEERPAFDRISSVPIRIDRIQINDAIRTRPDFLESLFGRFKEARTLFDLTVELHRAMERVDRMELFREIKVRLDHSDENNLATADDQEHRVKIVMDVQERNVKLQAGTEVGNGDIGWTCRSSAYNVFGRGERADLSINVGTQSSRPLLFEFSKPLVEKDAVIAVSVGSSIERYLNGSPFIQNIREGSLSLAAAGHRLALNHTWRQLGDVPDGTAVRIRKDAGHHFRTTISHLWTLDKREDSVFPQQGFFARLSNVLTFPPSILLFRKREKHFGSRNSLCSTCFR